MNRKEILKGTFIQPALIKDWNESDYDSHFEKYREIGFDHIILQWSEYKQVSTGKRYAYYPCKLPDRELEQDLLTNLLKYGFKHNIKVYIGLNINDDWWATIMQPPSKFYKWMNEEVIISIKLIDDIFSRYSSSGWFDAAAGWYLPLEVDNLNFNSVEKQNILSSHYNLIINHARKTSKLPIMISPFFNRAFSMVYGPKQWYKMWFNILGQVDIDIFALQDGVGCIRELPIFEDEERKKAIETVGEWFKAAREAVEKTGGRTKLWADVETFTEEFVDCKRKFKAAPLERIIHQMQAERAYVEKFTSFSFQAYQDYDKDEALFNQYRQYAARTTETN